MLNFEIQQVEHNMSSSWQAPLTSSQGENIRNRGGDQQSAVATLQNVVEAPPASSEGAQVQDSNQGAMRKGYKRHSHLQKKEMER